MSQKISLPSEILNVRFFYATEKATVHDYSGDNFGDYVKKKKNLNLWGTIRKEIFINTCICRDIEVNSVCLDEHQWILKGTRASCQWSTIHRFRYCKESSWFEISLPE